MSALFKRILVPLDGSRLAEAVLPVVGMMARCLGAEIMLLHIVEERAPQTIHGEPHLTSASQAEAYLERVASQLGPGLTVEQHVHGTEEHDVALSIASHAGELDADMIALCTHGRGGPRRVVSGSIAQQALQRVTTPILLVRPNMPAATAINTLLMPLDGTPAGECALPVAADVARTCGAGVLLASVVPTVTTVTGDSSAAARLTPISTAATLDAQQEQSRAYLAARVKQLADEGVQASAEVLRGETVQMLAEAAAKSGASLIVIATHGRAGLGAFWIGSVAAGLVGKVDQPLLLVRISDPLLRDKEQG